MKIEKGKEYMAGPRNAWKCVAQTGKSSKGTVLVYWLTGHLKEREARILARDMKPTQVAKEKK